MCSQYRVPVGCNVSIMSDLLINIRVGLYHFQLTRSFKVRISRNAMHEGYPFGRFKVYEFVGYRSAG